MKTSSILLIVIAIAAVAVIGYYAYTTVYQPSLTPTANVTFQLANPVTGYNGTVLTVDGANYTASQLPMTFIWNVNSTHLYRWTMSLARDYIWTSTTGVSSLRSCNYTVSANGTILTSYGPWAFKVAAVYVTPIEEDWNQVLHQALIKARDNLNITYSYAERTSESDCDRVVREYINNGYNLIITDSWGFWETSDTVAPQFPNVFFCQGSGLNTHFGTNLILTDNTLQEVTFQAGAVAAWLTNTDKIGVVAAMPGPGDVASLISGYIAGAKYVNPNINVSVQYIGEWYNPNSAKIKAEVMIASGIDVIFSERYGVFEACKQGDEVVAYAFGNVIDQNYLGPDVTVGSVIWNLYPLVETMITNALNDNFTSGVYYPTMTNNGTYMQWNSAWTTKFPTIYNDAVDLQPLIMNGTITWVVDNQTVPLSVPNFGTPQP